jgi:hypothetical protein
VARSRHITAFRRKAWLNQAGCYVLYWYLESEAKRLCGEAGIRGADGDEFATGKWELASCQCPHRHCSTAQGGQRPWGRMVDRRRITRPQEGQRTT